MHKKYRSMWFRTEMVLPPTQSCFCYSWLKASILRVTSRKRRLLNSSYHGLILGSRKESGEKAEKTMS